MPSPRPTSVAAVALGEVAALVEAAVPASSDDVRLRVSTTIHAPSRDPLTSSSNRASGSSSTTTSSDGGVPSTCRRTSYGRFTSSGTV